MRRLTLDVSPRPEGGATLALDGEIDVATSPQVETAARERLAEGPLLLDLRQVTFMDSSGVRVLSVLMKDCAARGWDLEICEELQPAVLQVLELTGMRSVLPLRPCGAA